MKKNIYFILDHYDRQIIPQIIDKYNLPPMEATKKFILSKTHALLEDYDNGLLNLPYYAVFDMWEVEQVTGDPCQSSYIRGE